MGITGTIGARKPLLVIAGRVQTEPFQSVRGTRAGRFLETCRGERKMYDAVGVEIKKGDVLVNFHTWSSSGIRVRCKVAVDFTPTRVVVGPTKSIKSYWGNKHTNKRELIAPGSSVVVNHAWVNYLQKTDIQKVLQECKITPNFNDIRKPTEVRPVREEPEDLTEL